MCALLGACHAMTPLPDEKRWEIIQSFKSLKSVALVSRALKLDRKVVRRWIDRYNSTGSVAARKPGGRKPSLTTSQAALALERLTSCSTSTAASVAKQGPVGVDWTKWQDVCVDRRDWRRILKAMSE